MFVIFTSISPFFQIVESVEGSILLHILTIILDILTNNIFLSLYVHANATTVIVVNFKRK
jgi:hypothetical protein